MKIFAMCSMFLLLFLPGVRVNKMNEFITNPEDCESIQVETLKRGNKELVEQNIRLQAELDREIKINREMKKALEKYANNTNGGVDLHSNKYKKWLKSEDGYKLAKQVLKEIENKE